MESAAAFRLPKTRACWRLVVAATVWVMGCSENPFQPGDEPPGQLRNPFEQNRRLGRGINLGNALEAPNEGDWGVVLQEVYFDLIKQAGFQSVRIPVRWSAHVGRTAPFRLEASLLRRVDWAIEQALSRDLAVIVNIHHYDEIMQDAASYRAQFLAIWKQLADHYKDYSYDLCFEILNEPHGSLTPTLWNIYQQEAVALIRESNPHRTLLVTPANWGGTGAVSTLELPAEDDNLIVTVHYYSPFQFTHQGAEWVPGSDAWLGTTWNGSAAERQAVTADCQAVHDWALVHNRPVNLGEFGAYSKADMESRVRWTSFVARTAEAFDMSWHYWEFISGFGVYDGETNSWHEALLRALIPLQTLTAL